MPSFNQADFLEAAIESVIGQAYPHLELIVMDGGSSDRSVSILEKYDRHIAFWCSEPDQGQSDALNKGFRRATGDIIGWLNSDDTYQSGALSAVAEVFADPDVMIAMCDRFNFIDRLGSYRGQKLNEYKDHETLIRYWATDGMTINQPSVFFRREVIAHFDPVLDVGLHFAMDYDLWLRLTGYHPIRVVSGAWANYRYHESSKTVGQSTKFVPEWYTVSRRFWGRKYSPHWWRLWLDHFYHWRLRRPLRLVLERIVGGADAR